MACPACCMASTACDCGPAASPGLTLLERAARIAHLHLRLAESPRDLHPGLAHAPHQLAQRPPQSLLLGSGLPHLGLLLPLALLTLLAWLTLLPLALLALLTLLPCSPCWR